MGNLVQLLDPEEFVTMTDPEIDRLNTALHAAIVDMVSSDPALRENLQKRVAGFAKETARLRKTSGGR
jgi:hypothetical protein